jgi:SOS-response transcriptional repressor LexA
MEELKERLKIAFSRAPSKRAIAAACGVSDQAITGWQKTGKVDHAHMPAIAKICRVRLQWLMTGEGEKEINSLEDLALAHNHTNDPSESVYRQDVYIPSKGYLTSDDIELLTRKTTKVPVISWIQAGDFCESPDLFNPGDSDEWLPCPSRHSKGTYALRVKNDSMTSSVPGERSYPHGTIIFVDPERAYTVGSRVVARLPGTSEATFKIYTEDAGQSYLMPINSKYPPIPIQEGTIICGVVIGSYWPE